MQRWSGTETLSLGTVIWASQSRQNFVFSALDWATDDNDSLQARDSVCSRNIQGLTQTYVTLSLSDIAQQVHLADASAAKQKVNPAMIIYQERQNSIVCNFECRLWQ